MSQDTSTYEAIQVSEFGGPDVLRVATLPLAKLQPGSGQILVKVYAAGINPVETYQRAGTYARLPKLPFTPGKECSGEVVKVGSGITRFRTGDRVFVYMAVSGAYSQYALVEEKMADILPKRISFEQGASIGTAYRTAFRALIHRAKGVPGNTVLVHGASGGVGIACVQLAVAYGMTVIGTAGTPQGLDLIKKQGCHAVLNHREKDYMTKLTELTDGRGVDIVIEMLANVNLDQDLKYLARGGVVAVVGNRGTININPRDMMLKESSVVGVLGWGTEQEQLESRTAIANGLKFFLSPVVGQTFPLNKCSESHIEVIEHAGGTAGKIVLLPWAKL